MVFLFDEQYLALAGDTLSLERKVKEKDERIEKLEAENIQLRQFCEEFNALNVAEENQRLKELLKNVTDEYDIEKQKALLKINELSGLLKECREWIEFMEEKSRADENYKGTMYFKNLLTKIDEALK